ncbi:DEAD-box ATP-dependent RNA helicase CshA [uncultured Candidatus Thioglobus sp.]|nr:DEAD-box ATP-dependent RNA helicase CshA [uncultured Candidatus Thioglobus sp.]
MTNNIESKSFLDLNLGDRLMQALRDVGYEHPSPIQEKTIPLVMDRKDVIGQAQTGTGKTAAFALPLLAHINIKKASPQALILVPTRELALQVAEAFQTYAKYIPAFHVLPIYGGQQYTSQLRSLKRGVHIVVGTPGRIMDHMRRNTLKLNTLECLVLDEADEMLRMGFIEDVEWILEQTPNSRQTILFSATISDEINKIAKKYLNDPKRITIKNKTTTVTTTEQWYWMVSSTQKLDALTRILESEETNGVIIFVRTRIATAELTKKLQAQGYAAIALNGDLQQKQREHAISQLKAKKLDILIATDVAARGLDIERISHVINYDLPNSTDAYIHRIGRTGRAGRTGIAILFVTPREQHWLRRIEKATKHKIEKMTLPSTETINNKRIDRFKKNIIEVLAEGNLGFYQKLIVECQQEYNIPEIEIAAALAKLAQGTEPLLLKPISDSKPKRTQQIDYKHTANSRKPATRRRKIATETMQTYRIEVGHLDNAKPSNIVGAIANEAGLDNKQIGHIEINSDHSLIDLPNDMPKTIFHALKKTWVAGKKLDIKQVSDKRNKKTLSKKPALKKLQLPKKTA